MSWYQSPVRPYDPVIEDEADNKAIRYLRDNFAGGGQDSNTLPPAQNQASWQQLTNVQPITQNVLSKRWGYNFIAGYTANAVTRGYSYQNNITLDRKLVFCSSDTVEALSENGALAAQVFTPTGEVAPRLVDSRNYAYLYDGIAADLVKWDGVGNFTTTNWGIVAPGLSSISSSSGPNAPSVAAQVGSGQTWTNPTNVLTSNAVYTTASIADGTPTTKSIKVTGFGFAIPGGATILGIKAEIQGYYTSAGPGSANAVGQLLKAGTLYGAARSVGLKFNTPEAYSNFSSIYIPNSDLWGGSWTAADINNANFGVQFYVNQTGAISPRGTQLLNIDFLRVTIYYSVANAAILVATGGAGNITLTVGRTYYCVYNNSITGHLSDLSPASASSGPVTNKQLNLTNIPVSPDAQVDSKVILATADGGDPSILYFVASIPNATTTYTDNTDEITLLLNQQYLFTDSFGNEFGITFNDPPPSGTICIKHKGRLWMAQQQNLFFSKATAELTLPDGFIAGKYEESWPPQNYFDISGGAETISGLLSDGNVIYIGTQSHIRRVFGDSPANFQQPEICHQDVGVLSQESWQNVFLEGTPVGFMWLSPDFKVMGSDGNTYLDLGHPIQDVLNSINPAAAQNAHAMFVQQGPYDLFILGIPTGNNTYCDTHCVFDLRDKQWSIWNPADPSTTMLFNLTASGAPQWLFAAIGLGGNQFIFQYQPTALTDQANLQGGFTITATATTPWLHLGSPTTRKILDELELIGDTAMSVSIYGAQVQADFSAPITIINNAPLVLGPFGSYKVYLSGLASKYKYYQFKFSSSSTNQNFLDSFAVRAVPWNTL